MFEEKRIKIAQTVEYLNSRKTINPKIAIVLGSGLGGLTEKIEIVDEIPYKEIPNFPVSTVQGHKGTMIFGRLNGVEVVVFNGRFHYYEGYPMDVVTYPQQIRQQSVVRSERRHARPPFPEHERGLFATVAEIGAPDG